MRSQYTIFTTLLASEAKAFIDGLIHPTPVPGSAKCVIADAKTLMVSFSTEADGPFSVTEGEEDCRRTAKVFVSAHVAYVGYEEPLQFIE